MGAHKETHRPERSVSGGQRSPRPRRCAKSDAKDDVERLFPRLRDDAARLRAILDIENIAIWIPVHRFFESACHHARGRLVLLSIIDVADGSLRWLGLIGIVPLLTGLAGNCPVYTLLGFDTRQLPM